MGGGHWSSIFIHQLPPVGDKVETDNRKLIIQLSTPPPDIGDCQPLANDSPVGILTRSDKTAALFPTHGSRAIGLGESFFRFFVTFELSSAGVISL